MLRSLRYTACDFTCSRSLEDVVAHGEAMEGHDVLAMAFQSRGPGIGKSTGKYLKLRVELQLRYQEPGPFPVDFPVRLSLDYSFVSPATPATKLPELCGVCP